MREQGKLDDELEAQIRGAETKARLEDIYLPFKPKRRTKAQIAREAGLEPLADGLLGDPSVDPLGRRGRVRRRRQGRGGRRRRRWTARARSSPSGSREDADLIGELRERMWARGRLAAKVRDGKEEAGAKFADYFDFAEPFTELPSHRILAMLRGEKEEVLDLVLEPEEPAREQPGPSSYEGDRSPTVSAIADRGRPADKWLDGHGPLGLADPDPGAPRDRPAAAAAHGRRGRGGARLRGEPARPAARRAGRHARDAGPRPRLPYGREGRRRGRDRQGRRHGRHLPARPGEQVGRGRSPTLARLAKEHAVELIAIGNGTASRETDKLAGELIAKHPELKLTKVMVSEAGASVYSASAFASQELPDMDVSLRGAVSIARRLQDPLAELVKIDPKSIGVGQYQHDLSEVKLSRSLDAVVEDCVNGVGVDVNTASAPLLSRVSGIGSGLAENIVAHRDANGPFRPAGAAEGRGAARPEGVRAVRGLPADPRRRRPAGRVQRAPGGVSRWCGGW